MGTEREVTMPGPVPKRSTERRRRNKAEQPTEVVLLEPGTVDIPEPDSAWHPVATR
jgi:hypothetical protein